MNGRLEHGNTSVPTFSPANSQQCRRLATPGGILAGRTNFQVMCTLGMPRRVPVYKPLSPCPPTSFLHGVLNQHPIFTAACSVSPTQFLRPALGSMSLLIPFAQYHQYCTSSDATFFSLSLLACELVKEENLLRTIIIASLYLTNH